MALQNLIHLLSIEFIPDQIKGTQVFKLIFLKYFYQLSIVVEFHRVDIDKGEMCTKFKLFPGNKILHQLTI